MERDRVVDLGADLARREILAQRVADRSRHADDVLVVHVEIAGYTRAASVTNSVKPCDRKQTPVAAGGLAAKARVQASRCRNLTRSTAAWMASSRELKPTSWWWYLGSMPWTRSRATERPSTGSSVSHHAAVAETAQVFGWIEAQCRRMAQAAGTATLVCRTDGLSRILEHEQAVLAARSLRSGPCRQSGHKDGPG